MSAYLSLLPPIHLLSEEEEISKTQSELKNHFIHQLSNDHNRNWKEKV